MPKPKIHQTSTKELGEGPTLFDFDMDIKQDSEIGILLIYTAYSKVNPKTDPNAWSFSTATKYTGNMEFIVRNDLENKEKVKLDLRRRNEDKSIKDIEEEYELTAEKPYEYKTLTSLFPGEKLEFYLSKPYS